MKKAGVLAIALASVFVCGIAAACGTQNVPAGNGESETKEPAGDSDARKSPQELVWDEAAKLEFTNVTITLTGPMRGDEDGGEGVEENIYSETRKIDAANRRIYQERGDAPTQYEFFELADGVFYRFSRGSEAAPWEKEESKEDAENEYKFFLAVPFELGPFEDYTYDEGTGKYVTTVVGKSTMSESLFLDKEQWEDYFVRREVKFEDGKLAEFYGEGNDGRWQRYVFSDYGTTVVTVPKEGSRLYGGDPHVTAEAWADNISLPYANVTMDVIMGYGDMDVSEKTVTEYLWDLGNHRIRKAGGVFHDYSYMNLSQAEYFAQTGNEYIYIDGMQNKTADANGEKYRQNAPQGFAERELACLGAFEEYTYDEEGECYASTAEKVTEQRTYSKRTVQFEDGKLKRIFLEVSMTEYKINLTYEIVFYDYGSTAVELPTL